MAETKADQSFSCPVCHEDLKEPKILPCTHLVCRECLLSMLKKKRGIRKLDCPECQSPLFKTEPQDFDLFVDELPTDHVTGVKVESQKTLTGSSVCTICDNSSEAEAFCFECHTKLCSSCAKVHSKLPSSSDHTVENLRSLTAEQLAAKKCFPCSSHKGKSAELYCSVHEELVCYQCGFSSHKKCDGIDEITIAAKGKRQELEEQKKRLTDKEASLSVQIEDCDSQVTEAEANFAEMRDRVITVFSDLIKSLEDQKQKLLGEIRQKEQIFVDEKLVNKRELQVMRSSVEAHVNSVDNLLSSAPDQAFLATFGRLKSRLDEVESESLTDGKATVGDVHFDENVLNGLKRTAANTGEVRDSPPEQDKSRLIHCYICNAISVTEGTFQFVIEKPERGSPRLMSQPCIIRNMPWKIDVRPWYKDEEQLGLFLHNGVSSESEFARASPQTKADILHHKPVLSKLHRSWSCKVKTTLRLLRVDSRGKFERPEFDHVFKSTTPNHGYPAFIAMTKLSDPNYGYLKDGKLTFEVHIAADAPKGTW